MSEAAPPPPPEAVQHAVVERLGQQLRVVGALSQALASHERELRALVELSRAGAQEHAVTEEEHPAADRDGCASADLVIRSIPIGRSVSRDPGRFVPRNSCASSGAEEPGLGLLPTWSAQVDHSAFTHSIMGLRAGLYMRRSVSNICQDEGTSTLVSWARRAWAACVWLPGSHSRILWDFVSVVAITWDLVVLPLSAFNVDAIAFVNVVGLSTMTFWIVDVFCSFFLAYYRPDGQLETQPWLIAKHYLSTWFPLDISLVALDVSFRMWLTVNGGFAKAGKSAKVLSLVRTLRMLRMMRVLKLPRVMDNLIGSTVSTLIAVVLSVLRLLAEVAFATHCIGCGWYSLGMWNGVEDGWMRPYVDADLPYRYILAFHWTIAQFTPAPNRIHPTNRRETIFAVAVLFVGLVVFSNLIGRVTALVAKSTREASERSAETDRLRTLCREKALSSDLGRRLMRFSECGPEGKVKRALVEADVRCLEAIPTTLLVDLRYEMHAKVLVHHPCFYTLREVRNSTLSDVCFTAVREDPIAAGDTPIRRNTGATALIFVGGPGFMYKVEAASPSPSSGPPLVCGSELELQPGTWLCEGALWTQWAHRGTVEASRPGAILAVNSERFRNACVGGASTALPLLRLYAQHWLHRLTIACRCGPVDDLWGAFGPDEDVLSVLAHPLEEAAIEDGPPDGEDAASILFGHVSSLDLGGMEKDTACAAEEEVVEGPRVQCSL